MARRREESANTELTELSSNQRPLMRIYQHIAATHIIKKCNQTHCNGCTAAATPISRSTLYPRRREPQNNTINNDKDDKHHMPISPRSSSAADPGQPCWDVQEILAERTSLTGENELLVVWKPSWICVSNVKAKNPAMMRFRATPMLNFTSRNCGMRTILPVEPETTIAVDRAVMKQMVMHSKRGRRGPANHTASHPPGRKKEHGLTAKESQKNSVKK